MDYFPGAADRAPAGSSRTVLISTILLVGLVLVIGVVDFTTELQWFDSLNFSTVFITSIYARIALFAAGSLIFLAAFATNVIIARRLAYRTDLRPRRTAMSGTWEDLLTQIGSQMAERGRGYSRIINIGLLIAGLILAGFMGLLAAGHWLTVLQVIHRRGFGISDPALGQDIGFYVFVLPSLRALEGWLIMALVLVVLASVAVHAVVLSYELAVNIGAGGLPITTGLKRHLLCLAALGFLLIAGHHILDLFDVVRSTRGAAVGAMYTDFHIQRPAQLLAAAAAVLAAVLCLVNLATSTLRTAITGGAIWLGTVVVATIIAPAVVQSLDVTPNELDRERSFLEWNIKYTRQAFGLDRVDDRDVAFEEAVSPAAASEDRETINNIRLWDHRPLRDTYNQIQAIRQYYRFGDVDIDRYTIDGEYRQVMLSARELDTDRLPKEAQSWVSRQLQYTHGYGVAMSPVNVISQEGFPEFTVKDVPPQGKVPIGRPEIYFGEQTNHYVITHTTTPEFDYPRGDQGVFVSRYQSDAGIEIGSIGQRLLYGLKFQDPNFLLNGAFQSDSRLLFRRNITDRVRQLAPFLRLDTDPYIVVAEGSLYWIQDAYTVSDRYPYAQPYAAAAQADRSVRARGFNYIRNSVKVVTSAYDGSMRFFVVDESDPMIQTYRAIFPDLFSPISAAPPSIRSHFRYPEGLFRIQAEVYKKYHMEDPRVFYLREDEWTIPFELFNNERQAVEPYYVIMKLPGETRPEFILMLPFTPRNRDNMVGWLAARSDEPGIGQMVVFKYPKDKIIFGPFQIETRIDQDTIISQQLALWNQAGSKVIRGNMLVIPIGASNLYVEPIYLQSTASPIPELKRVVVATGNRIFMEPTLEEGLAKLFGQQPPQIAAPTVGTSPAVSSGLVQTASQLAAEAQDYFRRAQEALRAGDFAGYGEAVRQVEQTIGKLVEITRPATN